MAEEPSSGGIQFRLGQVHLTTTLALIGALIGGTYTAVEWITRIQETTRHNIAKLEELQKKLDATEKALHEAGDREDQTVNALGDRIFQLQQQVSQMLQDYRDVRRLEDRYDRAFATYKPQRKRR